MGTQNPDLEFGALTEDLDSDVELFDFDESETEPEFEPEPDRGHVPASVESEADDEPEPEPLEDPESPQPTDAVPDKVDHKPPPEPQTAPARNVSRAGPPVVAICGTGGGAGTTTVAALMAFISAQQNLGPVLLTDLGGPSASLAAILGKRSGYSLGSAANAHRAGLFGTNGREPFINLDRNLRLLAREPNALDQTPGGQDQALRDLLIDAQEDHFATFVDCGRLEQESEQQVAAAATHLVWVAGGTRTAARKARAKIQTLGFHGTRLSILYVRSETGTVPEMAAQQEFGKAADENGLAIVIAPQFGDLVEQGLMATATRAKKPLTAALERILS